MLGSILPDGSGVGLEEGPKENEGIPVGPNEKEGEALFCWLGARLREGVSLS